MRIAWQCPLDGELSFTVEDEGVFSCIQNANALLRGEGVVAHEVEGESVDFVFEAVPLLGGVGDVGIVEGEGFGVGVVLARSAHAIDGGEVVAVLRGDSSAGHPEVVGHEAS